MLYVGTYFDQLCNLLLNVVSNENVHSNVVRMTHF